MSRIAIFSDVHGNLPALETVLSDINKRNIDQVYCLGDLVDFAPWTNEVIELIKGLRISCLMGNHDERIAFDYDIVPLKKHSDEETTARIVAINYTKKTIANANQKFLKNLPGQLRLSFKVAERNVNILLVHASTRSNDEYIYESHDMHDLYEMLEKEESEILVMGHTHHSYIRQFNCNGEKWAKQAINCGSVGRLKEGQPFATYLVLEIDSQQVKAEIIKLKYPVDQTIESIRNSEIPNFYADFLL